MNILVLLLQDASGQEFTVVLLDSEGIDAVTSEGSDDHCVFTLTILLASVFIYNSAGVPTRSDLDGLQYLLELLTKLIILEIPLIVHGRREFLCWVTSSEANVTIFTVLLFIRSLIIDLLLQSCFFFSVQFYVLIHFYLYYSCYKILQKLFAGSMLIVVLITEMVIPQIHVSLLLSFSSLS